MTDETKAPDVQPATDADVSYWIQKSDHYDSTQHDTHGELPHTYVMPRLFVRSLFARIEAQQEIVERESAASMELAVKCDNLQAEIERLRGLCGRARDIMDGVPYGSSGRKLLRNELDRASKGETT